MTALRTTLCVFLFLVALPVESVPTFSKFFLMVFENHGYNQVTGHSGWASIINDGYLLTNYWSMLHASQPNYVAIMSGCYVGCTSESVVYLTYTNLVDVMEEKGVTWKSYNEGYFPDSNGGCSYSATGQYARNHNPFISWTTITQNNTRCQNVLNAEQAFVDIKNNNLAQFTFYVPDNYNNSHDKELDFSASYLSNWLNNWYYPYLETTWKDTLFMITWDEDGKDENNHIMAMFKHPCVQAGSGSEYYDHYSVTRFVIENFGLSYLGRNDTVSENFAKTLPLKCAGSANTGGGSAGAGTAKPTYEHDRGTYMEGDPIHISSGSKSSNILIMFCIALSCLVIPGVRLWLHHESKKKHDLEKEAYLLPDYQYHTPTTKLISIHDQHIAYGGNYTKF